jgi:adenylyltransferase/sulfurtransferase
VSAGTLSAGSDLPVALRPDYSRQISLKEIGAEGQARLAAARVLVVGAGGLGSPVLQYLAGAGVGALTIVDGDVLEASNLHRQPLYARADTGRPKAELARAAINSLNPAVHVDVHAVRLDAGNAAELLDGCDLVVDCSDNFRTKFLINDAAVLGRKPAVFASVYQYEGEIQIYKPAPTHACLRCLWPDATADGIVGNCAEAGVLGPVAGALGSLQAILCLKLLLGLPGQLDGELLLLDFTSFRAQAVKAPRRPGCAAPGCERITALPDREPDLQTALETVLASLEAAIEAGWQLIDIRNDAEVAAYALGLARHIPMPRLLADPSQLDPAARHLLICASGRRSLAAARELRARGLRVTSLAGGLESLRLRARPDAASTHHAI